ncbi:MULTISPECIES: hypothetical protein [Bacillus]|uniref:hypothetical protein n=1 Tax=Bacillus TaxID=1386 RepID=UPI0002DB99F5|nr:MULTISPECIES: hypothetical protein [Bacillus]
MEKTLIIDGKEIKFKSTGAAPLRYKHQFGRDFFADIMSMRKLTEKKKITPEDIKLIDFDLFYNLAWVWAKTADKTIPEPMEWLDSFDSFPMFEIVPELKGLLINTLQSKKK